MRTLRRKYLVASQTGALFQLHSSTGSLHAASDNTCHHILPSTGASLAAIDSPAVRPPKAWMVQWARQFTDLSDGLLRDKRLLMHDRDTNFTRDFNKVL